MKTTTFIVEVEKALDWNAGYLNWDNQVVEDIADANEFEDEESAHFFNAKYGRNGRIYARVR